MYLVLFISARYVELLIKCGLIQILKLNSAFKAEICVITVRNSSKSFVNELKLNGDAPGLHVI